MKSPSTRFQRLDALRALRSLLLRVVERLSADTRLTGGDLRDLNRAIADPVRARLEPAPNGGYQVDMQALASSWREFAVRELAGSFVALLRRSHPPRINVCANGDCRRAFYDETKAEPAAGATHRPAGTASASAATVRAAAFDTSGYFQGWPQGK